jgi:hypothetical protein
MEIDETAKDAAVFGIEPPPSKAAVNYEVEPDAWAAVRVFLKVQTQWRTDSGTLIGLDYSAVRWVFDLLQIADPAEVFSDLQIIEATVVGAINKRKG